MGENLLNGRSTGRRDQIYPNSSPKTRQEKRLVWEKDNSDLPRPLEAGHG